MTNKSILLGTAVLMAACSSPRLTVEVTNPAGFDREHETVEIAWDQLAQLDRLTPENVVVLSDGEQIPSQVLYREQQPRTLIFQVDVDADEARRYTIATGTREDYPQKAFGRYVPERYDDYAWENDKVAYRAYGPALETTPGEMLSTPGFDVWVKSTDELVIDRRYQRGDYHHDYGDGMDCYKVGRTLGGGASAPCIDGQLWLSGNYATQQTLDNGPVRTTVRLTYAPFEAAGHKVALVKVISLDAHSRFNRMENTYTGDFDRLPVAAGFVRHQVRELATGEGWLALCEAASDSKDPAADGDIFLSVVLPGADMKADEAGHAVALTEVANGIPMVYYAGSGWSRGGVDDMEEWTETAREQAAALAAPLQVRILE